MFGGAVLMENYERMTLIQFQKQYATEEACQTHLFNLKWPEGYQCDKCDHKHYYKIKTRKLDLYECSDCHYQSTVTVGTVFEKTRTSLTKWFLAIYLFSHDKRGVSSYMLSNELEVTYKTAWLMLHKIRKAMGERDKNYALSGIIELDDAFLVHLQKVQKEVVVPIRRPS